MELDGSSRIVGLIQRICCRFNPKRTPVLIRKILRGKVREREGEMRRGEMRGGGREERKRRGGSNFIQLFSNSIDRHTNSPPLGNLPAHYLKRICFPSLREVGWGGGGRREKGKKQHLLSTASFDSRPNMSFRLTQYESVMQHWSNDLFGFMEYWNLYI